MRTIQLAVLAALLSAAISDARAYELQWITIDGGGGTISGGGYAADITVGQPEAGTAVGGGYVLQTGFWPGPWATLPPVPPMLSAGLAGSDLVLAWPAALGAVVVEEAGSLGDPAAWQAVPVNPAPVGDTLRVTLPRGAAAAFYRLRLGP
jgi:hypothetical protein